MKTSATERTAPQMIAKKMEENVVFALKNNMDIDPRWFYTMLECTCEAEGISFENNNAQFNFFTAVNKQMDKKIHKNVFK